MSKDIVKQDINFLEYPTWFQDKHVAEQKEDGYTWRDRENYIYQAGYKPPTKTDILFLYYLLLHCQQNEWKEELEITRYIVLKNCGYGLTSPCYARLEDSLNRWAAVRIIFQGTFYDGNEYQKINFGIIDTWNLEKKTKKLHIRFSSEWLLKIKESNYFKYINFDQVKALRSPLVIRLYEILIKSFQNRNKWEIDSMKLAQKIPMSEKYPADVIPKIKAAVNRINEHTTLKVKLFVRRQKRGKAIFVFEKLTEEEAKQLSPTAGLPEDDIFKSLTAFLPKEHRDKKTILEAVASSYKKHGFDYTARNIRYTNRNCKGNYRAYLSKALKEDWGLTIEEDEQGRQKAIKEQEQRRRQEFEALKQQKELQSQVRAHMDTLSSEERETLKKEAIGRLDEETKTSAEKIGNIDLIVKMEMEEIIGERLKNSLFRMVIEEVVKKS